MHLSMFCPKLVSCVNNNTFIKYQTHIHTKVIASEAKTRGGIIESQRRYSKKEKLLMISIPEKISIQSHSFRKGSLGLPASNPQRISGIIRKPESVPEKILVPGSFLASPGRHLCRWGLVRLVFRN